MHYFGDRLTGAHRLSHARLPRNDALSEIEHGIDVGRRDEDDPVRIGDHIIALLDRHVGEWNGLSHRELHDPTARADGHNGTTVHRKAQLLALCDVAARAVDHDSCDLTLRRGQSEYSAEAGDVDSAAVRDHEHIAGPGGVDRRGSDVLRRPIALSRTSGDGVRAPGDWGW
jgi:hypothetical protein